MIIPYVPMLVPPKKWKGYDMNSTCHDVHLAFHVVFFRVVNTLICYDKLTAFVLTSLKVCNVGKSRL